MMRYSNFSKTSLKDTPSDHLCTMDQTNCLSIRFWKLINAREAYDSMSPFTCMVCLFGVCIATDGVTRLMLTLSH